MIAYGDRIETQFFCPLGNRPDVGPGSKDTGIQFLPNQQVKSDLYGSSGAVVE
jgi:hypothetical protein